ncbi:hypothetical protein [Pantoea sp. AS142]|uniref:hypothetical protein n=1 Tax=Pantoea sp. AS142 TaxID=3081292 RepID=UPI0030168A56
MQNYTASVFDKYCAIPSGMTGVPQSRRKYIPVGSSAASMRRTSFFTARYLPFINTFSHILNVMIWPNREEKMYLKSKASAPGMARTIRMDAAILCDQAYLS